MYSPDDDRHQCDQIRGNKGDENNANSVRMAETGCLRRISVYPSREGKTLTLLYTAVTITVPIIISQFAMGT